MGLAQTNEVKQTGVRIGRRSESQRIFQALSRIRAVPTEPAVGTNQLAVALGQGMATDVAEGLSHSARTGSSRREFLFAQWGDAFVASPGEHLSCGIR